MDDGEEAIHHVVDLQEIGGGGDGVMDPLMISSSSSSHAKKDDKNGKEEKEEKWEKDEVELLIDQKLQEVGSSPSDYSIYRLPATQVNEMPEAYIPHRVSIGPIYHGWQHLKAMEARKMQCLQKFLNREPPEAAAATLSDYIKAVRDLEERAYQCYAEVDVEKFKGQSFVMMMVVDGCFLLKLLLDWNHEDKTFSEAKWSFIVLHDLILVENQLPMFVLDELYRVFIKGMRSDICTQRLYGHISDVFVPRISRMLLGKDNIIDKSSPNIQQLIQDTPKHLLDFVRRFLISPPSPKSFKSHLRSARAFAPSGLCGGRDGDPPEEVDILSFIKDNKVPRIRCARELEKAGVKFQKNNNPTSLTDIKFDDNTGVLTIPGLVIDHRTESILRNLVAYEQYTDDYSNITEYAAFMDGLIDSREDVDLLNEYGIVVIMLGDPTQVSRLFNNLLKDVVVPIWDTVPVRVRLEHCYNIRCHKWKASLMLNYFNSPWSFISLVAAIILLTLTVIQTIYAVLAYYHH
ncbi:UPF0481 protein At3g47200-like [Macadamia integrifolia]|uniref:UPF0481 protein At3g47200-like n=1 Tax=Macadamia integrifolia TaxID=60698 RepID=UPI001C4FC224|nr:UPF0481 protein At3g47200-like [Macadamia integrifolia]